MIGIVVLILSVVITAFICSKINRNTVGTTFAYIRRFFLVWLIVVAILAVIVHKIGLT